MTWLILPADDFAIRFAVQEYHMDFEVYDAAESFAGSSDVGVWTLFDGMNSSELHEYADADTVIDGSLNWDGCINWQTNQACMMHGCGPSHVEAIRNIFAAVYNFGKRHFELLGDEPPSMPEGAFEIVIGPPHAA